MPSGGFSGNVFAAGVVPAASAFTGQAFHRLAAQVNDERLEKAQIEIARAAAERFALSTDVLASDTTNFDTHITTCIGRDRHRCPDANER
jgi:hypothetical protein